MAGVFETCSRAKPLNRSDEQLEVDLTEQLSSQPLIQFDSARISQLSYPKAHEDLLQDLFWVTEISGNGVPTETTSELSESSESPQYVQDGRVYNIQEWDESTRAASLLTETNQTYGFRTRLKSQKSTAGPAIGIHVLSSFQKQKRYVYVL